MVQLLQRISCCIKDKGLRSTYVRYAVRFTGKFDPKAVANDKVLHEYVYAGSNMKPHNRVYAMGVTLHGALGVESFLRPKKKGLKIYKYMHRPYRVDFADKNEVTDVSCGYGYTVFSVKPTNGKSCFGTGITTSGQVGTHSPRRGYPLEMLLSPNPIEIPLEQDSFVNKVACGRAHTLVSTNNNILWTFGDNTYGQCGRPIIEKEDYSISKFHCIQFLKEKNIEQVECGQDTSFVLCDGKIYSCGLSTDGQLGQGTYTSLSSFGLIEVGDVRGEKIVKLSTRADCILALNDRGDVFGWGNNEYSQLGIISDKEHVSTPTVLPLKLPKVIDVGCSGTSCYVVTEDGDVYSWGYGSLGRGPNETISTEPKVIPPTLLGRNALNKDSKVTKIFTGTTMAAALTDEGILYTWGRNIGGCLGLGDNKHQYFFPLRVCLTGKVYKVSCGVDHMMVMARSVV